MKPSFRCAAITALFAALNGVAGIAASESALTLASPVLKDGGTLPTDFKCSRDGGDGASLPLEWSGVPEETIGFALIMHHYPRGTVEGRDAPSQYWLLWNLPADTRAIPTGNPASLGDEGSDKDGRETGYTPPCSPGSEVHAYTITLYALDAPLETLPSEDSRQVDWTKMTAALEGKVISQSSLMFQN